MKINTVKHSFYNPLVPFFKGRLNGCYMIDRLVMIYPCLIMTNHINMIKINYAMYSACLVKSGGARLTRRGLLNTVLFFEGVF